VAQAEKAFWNVLSQIRRRDDGRERPVEHIGREQRRGDGHEPETAEIVEHAVQRVAARAEHPHDLHIGDVAERNLARAEDRDPEGRGERHRREIAARGEDRDERVAEENREPADHDAGQGQQEREAGRVLDAAADLALADGLADHDDAGVAESDVEREGEVREGAEDRHAGVVLVTLVRVDDVEHEDAERPEALVENDRQRAGEELAQLPQREFAQLPHGAHEQILFKRGEEHDEHGAQPGGNAGRDGRALDAQLRQAELAEDEAVVREGVGDRRDD